MQPLISVIVPVYRVEAYLKACVASIQAQTYQNIEIILVDDGSPDNCPRICDELAAGDSRIRVIHQENGGLSSARNTGIQAATGEYIALLDSDDLWTPLFLSRLYEALSAHGCDMAVCLFRRFEDDPPLQVPDKVTPQVLTREEAFECLFNQRIENMVVAPNKLYRRSLFQTVRYPLGQLHEDEAVIHHVIGACSSIVWVEEAHYLYRTTHNSITTSRFNLRRLDEMKAKEDRIAYFESNGQLHLADKTRIVYLSNLMRLHRTALGNMEDAVLRNSTCRNIHRVFCRVYSRTLLNSASRTMKVRCLLFRLLPVPFSWLENIRLKRKGIT